MFIQPLLCAEKPKLQRTTILSSIQFTSVYLFIAYFQVFSAVSNLDFFLKFWYGFVIYMPQLCGHRIKHAQKDKCIWLALQDFWVTAFLDGFGLKAKVSHVTIVPRSTVVAITYHGKWYKQNFSHLYTGNLPGNSTPSRCFNVLLIKFKSVGTLPFKY